MIGLVLARPGHDAGHGDLLDASARAALDRVAVVSSTVRDLVVGSGIDFVERGTEMLKGVPGEWRLYSVAGLASSPVGT